MAEMKMLTSAVLELHNLLPVCRRSVSGPVLWTFLLISCAVPRTVGFPLLRVLTGWDPGLDARAVS
jgi:hypothetical protein